MLKAIKIRLYPTETQQITINKLLGCCRLVYNHCLEHRNKIYEETKEIGSLSKSQNILEEGKRIIGLSSPEFKRVGEQALVSSMNLEKHVGYQNIFLYFTEL